MKISIKVEVLTANDDIQDFDIEAQSFEEAEGKLKDIENYLNKKEAEQEARIDE